MGKAHSEGEARINMCRDKNMSGLPRDQKVDQVRPFEQCAEEKSIFQSSVEIRKGLACDVRS